MIDLGVPLALLVVALLLIGYRRQRSRLSRPDPGLDDDDVDRIISEGVVRFQPEEPLDLEEIEEAERRFWIEENWDESEEW